jgi:hypothetical protein
VFLAFNPPRVLLGLIVLWLYFTLWRENYDKVESAAPPAATQQSHRAADRFTEGVQVLLGDPVASSPLRIVTPDFLTDGAVVTGADRSCTKGFRAVRRGVRSRRTVPG